MHRSIRSLLAAVLAVAGLIAGSLTTPGVAAASTDFPFGTGSAPDVAVDAAGTAHVVWLDLSQGVGQARTVYCRIPRGARACTNPQVLYTGNYSTAPRVLLRSPQTVIVLLGNDFCSPTDNCMRIRVSADGGLSFALGTRIVAVGSFYADAGGEAVDGPGDSLSFVSEGNPTLTFTNSSLALGAQPTSMRAVLTPSYVYGATVGLYGNVPVVVYRDGDVLRWRRYVYSLICQNLNAAACWSPAQAIDTGPFGARASLAGGPSGLFLYYEQGPTGATQGVVRKFTGSGWSQAAPVTGTGYLRPGDLSQDASGRLHATWFNNGGADSRLLQWRTSTDGVNWGPTVTINATPDVFDSLHVGAAPDGQGFAVWNSGQPGGSWSYLRAVPLEPFTFPAQPSQPVQPPDQQPVDTSAPTVSGFAIGAYTLRGGQGTSFAFNASESGHALLTFYRLGHGLKLGPAGARRCLAKTDARLRALRKALAVTPSVVRLRGKALKHKLAKLVNARRCTTTERVGDIETSVQPGPNTIGFNGTLAGRTLKPGRYLAVLVIQDAAGNTSRREMVRFEIVSPKKPRPAPRALRAGERRARIGAAERSPG
jgi:hypothetical protein